MQSESWHSCSNLSLPRTWLSLKLCVTVLTLEELSLINAVMVLLSSGDAQQLYTLTQMAWIAHANARCPFYSNQCWGSNGTTECVDSRYTPLQWRNRPLNFSLALKIMPLRCRTRNSLPNLMLMLVRVWLHAQVSSELRQPSHWSTHRPAPPKGRGPAVRVTAAMNILPVEPRVVWPYGRMKARHELTRRQTAGGRE